MKKTMRIRCAVLMLAIWEIFLGFFIYYFAESFGGSKYYFNCGYHYPIELWVLFGILAVFGGLIPFCFSDLKEW